MTEYLFFPQANDLDKILKLINISNPEKIKHEEYVQMWLGDVAPRQARYYIHALRYLGLVDERKDLTYAGKAFRNMTSFSQEVELVRIIMSDNFVGSIYVKDNMSKKLSRNEIADLLQNAYPGFSKETYLRRAGNVRSWINWVSNKLNSDLFDQ